MRFYLVVISARGYRALSAFSAASVPEACRMHVDAYKTRGVPWALVMRGPDGKRYSFNDSKEQATSFMFTVGESYRTQEGYAVQVVGRYSTLRGYETVLGDDGRHRYDRSTHSDDAGRCTGTAHDYSYPYNFARPFGAALPPAQVEKPCQREAMQQAIAALEKSVDNFPANTQHRRAIAALTAALGVTASPATPE